MNKTKQPETFTTQKPGTLTNPLYPRVSEAEAQAQAWVFTSPDKLDKYFYRHTELNPKDVRCRVLFSAVTRTDIQTAREVIKNTNLPYCSGNEVVAEVIAVGKEVSNFKVGDRVLSGAIRDSCGACSMCQQSETHLCVNMSEEDRQLASGKYFGGLSTHIQRPESHLYKLDPSIPLATAAPLAFGGATVYRPLVKFGKPTERVGVVGVGNLGHMAVLFGRKMGMEMDALYCKENEDMYHEVLNLGVNKMVNMDCVETMEKMQDTYDMLIYLVPVALPAEKVDRLMKTLKTRGKFILIGIPTENQPFWVTNEVLLRKEVEIIGTYSAGRTNTEDMLKFVKNQNVQPVCEYFEFDDIQKVVDRVENKHPKFVCVLRVDQYSQRFKQ